MQHGSTLYRNGIDYYEHGTIKQGRQVKAYFYKLCKPATLKQIQALRDNFPYVRAGYGYSEYAPELQASVLIFPSKAELKRQSI